MKAPEFPADERTRLETLRSLQILDTLPEERFDRLTRLARKLFDVPIALVSLIDADRQWFKSSAGLEAKEPPREISFCGHAILTEDILAVTDTALDERFHDNPLVTGDPKIRFYAGCPLIVSNGKLGTLCLIGQEPREFDENDRALLHDLARIVEQELSAVQLATLDELTGLLNRRGFEALSQHGLDLCKRQNKPGCLLFLDLNDFKQVNDRYGHAEGDRALTEAGKLMMQVFRTSDVIGRLGGDEFVAFLIDATKADSEGAIARFTQTVERYNREASRGYDLSFSIGAVEYHADRHRNIGDLLKAADSLMYQHKRSRERS
jgi:diguanylate cyclase (GGDEF)-like protein